MRIESAFEVPVEMDAVWAALLDIERIAPCLPGASIDEHRGDGEYRGSMRIKLGPVTSTFKGTLRVAEADVGAHRAIVEASARDTRGQGAAAATITSTLEPAPGGTHVAVETDLKLAGTAAQFGRGVVDDVSQKLLAEFAERLAAEIQSPSALAAPATAAAHDPAGPAPAERHARPGARDDNVLDLTAAGREALLQRAVPAAAGLAAIVAVIALLTGRRGRGRRHARTAAIVLEGPLLVVQTGRRGRRRTKRS
jgi:uncharacterized protein